MNHLLLPGLRIPTRISLRPVIFTSSLEEFGITSEKDLSVDIDKILKSKNFIVKEVSLPENLSAVLDARNRKNPVLLVEQNLKAEEKRFAKAWELGQFLLDPIFEGIRTDKNIKPYTPLAGINQSDADKNAQKASNFAAELLMPKNLFAQEIKEKLQGENSSQSNDDVLKTIADIAAVFAVGAGIVLLAIALSGGKNGK